MDRKPLLEMKWRDPPRVGWWVEQLLCSPQKASWKIYQNWEEGIKWRRGPFKIHIMHVYLRLLGKFHLFFFLQRREFNFGEALRNNKVFLGSRTGRPFGTMCSLEWLHLGLGSLWVRCKDPALMSPTLVSSLISKVTTHWTVYVWGGIKKSFHSCPPNKRSTTHFLTFQLFGFDW